MIELRPKFRFLARFGPFYLVSGHFAWIWPILAGFGPFCLDLGPKGDKALRMGRGGRMDGWTDIRTDRQIPPVFYRTSSPSGPLPKS